MESLDRTSGVPQWRRPLARVTPRAWLRRSRSAVWRYTLAALYVAAASGVAELLTRAFGITRLSMIFLAAVLLAAVTLGTGPAFIAAAVAFSTYNFYLVEPRFTLGLSSGEDVIVLLTFLVVALLTGGLAGRVKDEAIRSKARARTMGVLFEASRVFSSEDEEDAIRRRLVEQIAAATKAPVMISYNDRAWSAGPEVTDVGSLGWRQRQLIIDDVDLGSVKWVAPSFPERAASEVDGLVLVIIDLGVSALARAGLASAKSRAEAVAKTEKLRTTLLSSLSHDLRTPITAVMTSVDSLIHYDGKFDADVRRDLLSTIREETERLSGYVSNLLHMTKLESGALAVDRSPILVAEVLARLIARFERRKGDRAFELDLQVEDLCAWGDAFLVEQALANVVENAIRFSPPGTTISIQGRRQGSDVGLEIVDEGRGVPPGERERIFEKFYRGENPAGNQQGTGLGLSIARGMIESMGGAIKATARPDGRTGLRVLIRLPTASPDE